MTSKDVKSSKNVSGSEQNFFTHAWSINFSPETIDKIILRVSARTRYKFTPSLNISRIFANILRVSKNISWSMTDGRTSTLITPTLYQKPFIIDQLTISKVNQVMKTFISNIYGRNVNVILTASEVLISISAKFN